MRKKSRTMRRRRRRSRLRRRMRKTSRWDRGRVFDLISSANNFSILLIELLGGGRNPKAASTAR